MVIFKLHSLIGAIVILSQTWPHQMFYDCLDMKGSLSLFGPFGSTRLQGFTSYSIGSTYCRPSLCIASITIFAGKWITSGVSMDGPGLQAG